MKKITAIAILALSLSTTAFAQDYERVEFKDIKYYLDKTDNTIYIINFWATWCKPCVREIDYFEEYNNNHGDKKVRVLLVSMDFEKEIEERLEPFLAEKQFKSTVLLMTDHDYNTWVDKVEPNWSGAIPFTLFQRGSDGMRYFKEGELKKGQIEKIINKYF